MGVEAGSDRLAERLGLSFHDGGLLRLALVHRSYLNESSGALEESNERLEFLGDALIGLAVAAEVYSRHPDWPEGDLTRARSELVNRDSLADAAARLDLGNHLYMGRGEEAGGGRERPTNLAAAFEALVGALLLDQGYEAAHEFVVKTLSDGLDALGRRGLVGNPKSALQELVQGRGEQAPTYSIVAVEGEEHARQFTAEVTIDGVAAGRGAGRRKSDAEQAAAAAALEAMGQSGPGTAGK